MVFDPVMPMANQTKLKPALKNQGIIIKINKNNNNNEN
jgi:hypothetical protein